MRDSMLKGNWDFLTPPRIAKIDTEASLFINEETTKQIFSYCIGNSVPNHIIYQNEAHQKDKFDWYRIRISSDGIVITACSDQAFFIAITTIRQLLSFAIEGFLCCGEIEDWADIEKRGVMLDVSRDRVCNNNTLKKLIDFYSLLKFNQFVLYIEHTFAYVGHEVVHQHASPYTPSDIKIIDSYCTERGIELIINQNSMGHMERFLQHEQYRVLAENPDGFLDPWGVFRPFSTTVSPIQKEVYPFYKDLYSQLCQVITTDYIHVGCDEPWGLGIGRSKKACDEKGIEYVYLEYIHELYDIVSSFGKKMMIWADVILKYPHIIPLINKDIIICQWEYEANVPIMDGCKALYDNGSVFYVGCGTSTWNALSGRWKNAYTHIKQAVHAAHTYHAKGLLVTEWGDNGHLQQLSFQIPPIVLAGVLSWNKDAESSLDFNILIASVLNMVPSLVSSDRVFKLCEYRTLSHVLLEIEKVGEIYESPIHNNTLLGAILLYHQVPYYHTTVIEAQGYIFERERTILHSLSDELSIELSNIDCLMKDELIFTIKLLLFLCDYGELLLQTKSLKIEEIPQYMRKKFASSLSILLKEYSRLWLITSRSGGLSDSSSRLQSLISLLEGT
jgi:hypothetical protein